ncbi:MAG: DUF4349 domain-containing protein [Puia sp.]|nr:DUF4349 domain-containing protein [Puia sp.]
MLLVRTAMPAALLLLLCAACNSHEKKEKVLLSENNKCSKNVLSHDQESFENSADTASIALTGGAGNELMEKPSNKEEDNKGKDKGIPAGKPLPANGDWDKKIVKTADLSLEVKNYKNFDGVLRNTVKRLGGYIAREEQTQSGYKIENTVVIRIPVAQFDDAVTRLTPDSEKLTGKKISADDVTMEVVDTKSRLEAKQRARSRYLDLLKNAKNMDEILQVQSTIDEIQEQMEAASGRIGYLGHEATFSTINLDFYQVLDAGVQGDEKPSFVHKFVEAFRTGLDGGADLMIVIVSLWPLWVMGGLTFLGIRKWRSGKIKKNPATVS